jgi:hypothetical protein
VYEWNTNPPEKYVGYVTKKDGMTQFSTWTGEKLGNITLGTAYKTYGYCASTRRPVWVLGTNGKRYHGTYYESSGDYARITMDKHQG